jgi:hypothetical protein
MNTLLRSSLLRLAVLLCCLTSSLAAQTTGFTYQGRLTDGGASASGPYDLQFKLYDAVTAGNQIGAIVLRDDVNVTNGVFSTNLDFGAAAFPGAARWLEISVRPGASTGAYTTLAPRQPVNSTPYAIRALSAETVTGPVPASQITGTLPPSALPPGGAYINNATTQQAASNFNISGNGTAGGTLSGNVVNAATQYNFGGQRVLSASANLANLVVGLRAGESLSTGDNNTFVGTNAGRLTQTAYGNAFFGANAGGLNELGNSNAFFGASAGAFNSMGYYNSFFGNGAGYLNSTGRFNAFFGGSTGLNNQTGAENSYFGVGAGDQTNASGNSFFGAFAGGTNKDGNYNTFLGHNAGHNAVGTQAHGDNNTFVGSQSGSVQANGNNNTLLGANTNTANNLSYATAIGAEATVSTNNTIVLGRLAGTDRTLVTGELYVNKIPGGGSTGLCFDFNAGRIAFCSSSQRYKANVQPLASSLDVIQRLRPVTFDWKDRNEHDLGFIAEEVAEVEPRLTFRNDKGEIEGVKYQLVSAVLVNAVKEQQAQIEQQQKQLKTQQEQFKQQQAELAQLKQLLCAAQPQAAVCQP